MMKIFKYPFNEDVIVNTIPMPKGAKILSAKVVQNKAQLWALVDPTNKMEDRKILSWTTGKDAPRGIEATTFLDTLIFDNGGYICHIFVV